MNNRLNRFLEDYAALERGVQDLVSARCCESCTFCAARCCRADICEEALSSPFLQALHGKEELDSDRYGFLTESGCGLEVGRPPVCYEFFCGEILEVQPDDLHRDMLRILGRLPGYAGENAQNNVHLTELRLAEQLDGVDFQTLENQLQQGIQALEIIRTFYDTGALPEDCRRAVYGIHVPSDD